MIRPADHAPQPDGHAEEPTPLIDAKEAAARVGVSIRTLRGWIADRRFPVVRFSRRCLRIRPEDVEAFIEERRAQ